MAILRKVFMYVALVQKLSKKNSEKSLIYIWLQTYLSFFSEIVVTLTIHSFFCFLKV